MLRGDRKPWSPSLYRLYAICLGATGNRGRPRCESAINEKNNNKNKWSSWVICHQSFRQDVEGAASQSWAKVDPSTYALWFTGQAKSSENLCTRCQSLDHAIVGCPDCHRIKRPWSTEFWSAHPIKPEKLSLLKIESGLWGLQV